MRYLYLLRHAKSLWNDASLQDFERPLSNRGTRDAKKMSEFIKREKISVDLVLCSSAIRTMQTLEEIKSSLGSTANVTIDESLYTFDPERVLARLAQVPPEILAVMIIGHNPAMQAIAASMAKPGALKQRLSAKYPTAALSMIALRNESWNLANPQVSQTDFVAPKDI